MKAMCPNCGRNPPRRGTDTVLCQECVDTCPQGPRVALQMEETFRMLIASGVKMPGLVMDGMYNATRRK